MSDPITHENRLKRMGMRSWRRGTKEMDLILGPYGDAHLPAMPETVLNLYEALLAEHDQDLYPWFTGAAPVPTRYEMLIADILRFAQVRQRGI